MCGGVGWAQFDDEERRKLIVSECVCVCVYIYVCARVMVFVCLRGCVCGREGDTV